VNDGRTEVDNNTQNKNLRVVALTRKNCSFEGMLAVKAPRLNHRPERQRETTR